MRKFCKTVALLALIGVLLLLGVVLYVVGATRASIYDSTADVPDSSTTRVVLVLGASIHQSGELSPVLRERADAAIQLYTDKKVSKILVSGDNSSLQYDEVYPVGKYLVAHDVPTSDVFLDYAGFDTYSSMYRAKEVFGVTSMVVASQRFHLPRALFIAHTLGIHVEGVDVSSTSDRFLTNALREIPATLKALFDLVSHRTPRYLGPTFSIAGDGSATWLASTSEMIYFRNAGQ